MFGNCQGLSVPEEKRLKIVREEIENLWLPEGQGGGGGR